jgi:hypothetical protein
VSASECRLLDATRSRTPDPIADEDTLRRVLDEPRKLRDRELGDDAPVSSPSALAKGETRRQKRHLARVG